MSFSQLLEAGRAAQAAQTTQSAQPAQPNPTTPAQSTQTIQQSPIASNQQQAGQQSPGSTSQPISQFVPTGQNPNVQQSQGRVDSSLQIDPSIELANMLASGQTPPNPTTQTPAGYYSQPNQQPGQQPPNAAPEQTLSPEEQNMTEAELVTTRFIKANGVPDMLRTVKVDELMQRMTEQGDQSAMSEMMQAVGQNAFTSAVESLMTLLPTIKQNITASVLEQVSAQAQDNDLWKEFITQNPGFAPYKHTIAPQLKSAAQHGQPKDVLFQAMKTIYGGLVAANQPPQQDTTNQQDQPFDITSWLSS